MRILETIEGKIRVQQNELLGAIDAKADATVLNDIKKLIKLNMIFSYKFGGNRYYELRPHEAFYKNLATQTEYRIKDIASILKKIEGQYVKYGPDVLNNIEYIFLHCEYNLRYYKNKISRMGYYGSLYDNAEYRKNVIRIISKIENEKILLGITNTAVIKTDQMCNKLHKDLIMLMHDRNKMNISEDRFTMDKKINSIEIKYTTLHKQFYIFEEYFYMQINDGQSTDDKSDYSDHSNTMQYVVINNTNESVDIEYSNEHEQILKIIGKYDGVTRQLLNSVLNEQRRLMSSNTIVKYVNELIKEGKIQSVKQGKKFVYYLSDDIRMITSKKQIGEIIEEWKNILSQIKQELSAHDIAVQRDMLYYLNQCFEQLQQFLANKFKEYDKHEIIVDYEKRINEIFDTIRDQTNIDELLKLVGEKFDQISDIVYEIGDTSNSFLLSKKLISTRLKNLLNQLEKNKIELDELYHKKINYDDLETTKNFDSIIKDIDSILHMILERPIKNIDEFYKIIRRTRMSLVHKHMIYLPYIKENMIALKTDMIKNDSNENEEFDKLKKQLLSLCKHSKKYKSIEKLISSCK